MNRALAFGVVSVLALSSIGSAALAQAPLEDGDYVLEVVDLPVLGDARGVGLGGAYGAMGEGSGALPWNPAAAASRHRWDTDWFEFEINFGAIFPSWADSSRLFGRTDAPNVAIKSFSLFDFGLRLQFGPASFGTLVRMRNFSVAETGQSTSSLTGHADFAWQFLEGDLVLGLGARIVSLDVEGVLSSGKTGELLSISGVNAELGAIYRPHARPFRIGVVGRLPLEAKDVESNASLVGTPYVPRSVNLPWEVAFSGAYGFGQRPLNTITPPLYRPRVQRRLEREQRARRDACMESATGLEPQTPASIFADTSPGRASAVPRDAPSVIPVSTPASSVPSGCDEPTPHLVGPVPMRPRYGFVTAELVLIGRTRDGIGLDGYLSQTERRWGSHVTVSPRIGVEGEPWRNRMKLRGGLYREPARSSLATPRAHFTAGFDLRLLDWDIFGLLKEPMGFQIAATSDFAREYVSVGVGVGVWH